MKGGRMSWAEAGLWLLAGLAAAAALHTAMGTGRYRALMSKKASEWAAVERMGTRWEAEREWLDELSRAGTATADVDGLRAVVEESLGTGKAEWEELHGAWEESGPAGWRVRRVVARAADVDYGDWGTAVVAAGEMRPPWRVVDVDLRAGPEAGRGDAEWVFEAIERDGEPVGALSDRHRGR